MKFVVVSGGVLSGLGKGITTASLGFLLKLRGYRVTAVKCDMYLNIDAGTMNPVEHGEVFVTHDGVETDQDLGHYERFLNTTLTRANYLTNGQIYKTVLDKERALGYGGACVEPYHHIPPEIVSRWERAANDHKAEIVFVELGGTVGEYEGLLFFEAVRRLRMKRPHDVCLVHVGYMPTPPSIGELKSKPLQQSVSLLNSLGLQPDFIVARAERPVDKKRKEKIAMASNITAEEVVSNPDVEIIYEVPLWLEKQNLPAMVLKKLHLPNRKPSFKEWKNLINKFKLAKNDVVIGIVGKYQRTGDYTLEDSYVCVVEALKHASWKIGVKPKIVWIDSEDLANLNQKQVSRFLSSFNGILVPQGWGSRGTEGKINAAQYAREHNVPYLGLCFGMQMATIEFARNVLGFKSANTQEVDLKTPYPVIHIMENQKEYLKQKQYGGTIRLGAWPCVLAPGSRLEAAYKKCGNNKNLPWYQPSPRDNTRKKLKVESRIIIYERHRHRYEFNNKYINQFERKGYKISGTSPDGKLVEAFELKNHKFFIGTQFHPEYLSRPLTPHPIFVEFMKAISVDK